jgi:hypothetical protein
MLLNFVSTFLYEVQWIAMSPLFCANLGYNSALQISIFPFQKMY